MATRDSHYWDGGKICDECAPYDEHIASDIAWHAMTGELPDG
jgi:hypothetical protein